MLIRGNAGDLVPWGRLIRTHSTNLEAGEIPSWLTVAAGTTAASPLPAGGLRVTGEVLRLEGPETLVADFPETPAGSQGAVGLKLDMHYTNGVLDTHLIRVGWTGANGTWGLEKLNASGTNPAALRFTVRDAAGAVVRSDRAEIVHGNANMSKNNDVKRYWLTLYYDVQDRALYAGEGEALQDTARFTATELVHGPVVPYVQFTADPVDAALFKDIHQLTVESQWI